MKKLLIILLSFAILFSVFFSNPVCVYAEDLNQNLEEQMNNLDFSAFEEFLNSIEGIEVEGFFSNVYSMLNGEYVFDSTSVLNNLLALAINYLKTFLPSLITIIAISIFTVIIQNSKSSFVSESVTEIIDFVAYLTVILILSSQLIYFWSISKNTIENISKLNEIMSPIILTLMIASGANSSVAIYKPSVTLFSNIVINVVNVVVIPLIGLILIFSVISTFSKTIKLGKFVDFFSGLVKWIIGIVVTCYGLFITVQGIASAVHDGISIKALKYTISNSIPLVGGMLKDGFDLIVASSILIKNAIGVAGVIILFSIVLTPFLKILVFSLMLNLVAAIVEMISDSKISYLCTCISKSLSLLNSATILTGFMMLISTVLMILSANSFV